MQIMATTTEQVHVARQPILDHRSEVFGYELLYRAEVADAACTGGTSEASARVLSNTLAGVGLETLADGRRAFLNLSRDVLLSDAGSLFAPGHVVLELLEDVEVTPEVMAMCKSLHERGYALALDDFTPGSAAEALLPLAKFVKLDVLALTAETLRAHAPRLRDQGVSVVAEKVETEEMFEWARDAGCTFFQGYYFCRPRTISMQALSATQLTRMQLLAALYQPDASIPHVEDLLKRDVSLSYRVLRCVNSAGFGLRREIGSIREGLVLLGLDQIRKWASLWALAGLNRGPSELVTMTVVRARACELMGLALGQPDRGAGFFLLGLCSLLDALLQRPLAQVIADLPLADELRAALLGQPNTARQVLDAVIAHEQGRWLDAAELTAALGLGTDALPAAFADALVWQRAAGQLGAAA